MKKKSFTVFYSWQSDRPSSTNRRFIERCLQQALREARSTPSFELDTFLDRDTQGTAGSPDIVATILAKIDAAQAFVGDVSIVDGQHRLCPNPNVLIELGYAAHSLSWNRIVLVCNEVYGAVEMLPFDIRQRRVLTYHLNENASAEEKTNARKKLVEAFKTSLGSIAADVQLQLAVGGEHSISGRIVRDLATTVNELLPFIEQVAEVNLSEEAHRNVTTFLTKARQGEESDSAAITLLASAFTNKETLLRHSGLSAKHKGPLTWMEFLTVMLERTNAWCGTTLQKYGSSPAISEAVIVIIENIQSVTEVLSRQMSIFEDDDNLPYHLQNIKTNVEKLLAEMVHALRLAAFNPVIESRLTRQWS
jgi:hypothetical protein